MDELDELIEEFEWRASLAGELSNSAFAMEDFDSFECQDRNKSKWNRVAELLEELKERRASEPFINKPCISEGVCHEDKMQMLDKLRADIIILKHDVDIAMYGIAIDDVLGIIDKYRTEEGGDNE